MEPKVSIVVPIYNVEDFIENCLNSLVNQTLKEIEVIMVNDGTPDNSAKIAQEYADKYYNFKLYHKKNGGLADARNFGMQYVNGEYVTFLDSDDMLTPNACEVMYKKAKEEDADIVIGRPFWKYDDGTEKPVEYLSHWFEKKLNTNFRENYKIAIGFPVGTSKLFKTALIKENNLKFPKIIGEDIVFSVYSYHKAKIISIIPNKIYLRTERQVEENKSITQTFNLKTVVDRLNGLNMIIEYCNENNLEKVKKDSIRILSHIHSIILKIDNREEKEKAFENYKKFLYYGLTEEEQNRLKEIIGISYYEILNMTMEEYELWRKMNKKQGNQGQINQSEKVSVIIPTYERPLNLERAINSVLNQSYKNIEIIVVDDNDPYTQSRRETEKLMAKYIDDNRIRYIKHPKNQNGAVARNTGIKEATGTYITFLDDDDEFLPDKINKQIQKINELEKDYGGVYCGVAWKKNDKIFKQPKFYPEGNLSKEILLLNNDMIISSSTLLIKKEVLDEIQGFDESFTRHQDYEMLIRFFRKYKIGVIPEVLVYSHKDDRQNLPNGEKLYYIKKLYLEKFKNDIEKFGMPVVEQIYEKNWKQVIDYLLNDGKSTKALRVIGELECSDRQLEKYIQYLLNNIQKNEDRKNTKLVSHSINKELNNKMVKLENENKKLKRELNLMRNSTSWRYTKYFRIIGDKIRKILKKES